MSDSYLLKSYAQTEREKVRKAAAAAELEAGLMQTEPAALGEPKPEQKPEPKPEPPKRDSGVLASVGRGLSAIGSRFREGGETLGKVVSPVTREDEGVGRAKNAFFGLLDSVFPFGAFAKETGGDLGMYAARITGQVTDEALDARIRAAEQGATMQVDQNAGELVGVAAAAGGGSSVELETLKQIRAMTYEQRLEGIRSLSGAASEIATGLIPGYTGAAKAIGKMGKGGALTGEIIDAPRALPGGGQKALGPGTPALGPGPAPAGPHPMPPAPELSAQQRLAREFSRPEHQRTATELVERMLEERRAAERTSASNLASERGNKFDMTREELRDAYATGVSLEIRQTTERMAARTIAEGGTTWSLLEGPYHGRNGFAVSVFPDRGEIVRGTASGADFAAFVAKNEDVLAQPGFYVGAWTSDGRTYLDISQVVPDRETALALGAQHNQLAVWDFANSSAIDVAADAAASPLRGAFDVAMGRQVDDAVDPAADAARVVDEAPVQQAEGAIDPNAPLGRLAPVDEILEAGQEPLQSSRGLGITDEARAAYEQMQRNEEILTGAGREDYAKSIIERAGGVFRGVTEDEGVRYVWFDDAPNGSTSFIPVSEVTSTALRGAIEESRAARTAENLGSAGAKVVGDGAAARERLREVWRSILKGIGDQNTFGMGILRGEITPKLVRQVVNDLTVVGAELMWEGARSFKAWSREMITEFGAPIRPHLKDLYELSQKKIEKLSAEFPDLPSMKEAVKLFHQGSDKMNWYDDVAEELTKAFGKVNGELFWKLVAATSPNTEVQANITMAKRAYAEIISGRRNAENLFVAGKRADGADGFMKAHADNLNNVLLGKPVEGPKAGPFAAAPYDPNQVVVDTWMFRAFGLVNKAGEPMDNLQNFQLVQRAVTRLGEEVGATPRQVQAAIWVAQKRIVEGPDTLVSSFMDVMKLVEAKHAARAAKAETRALRAASKGKQLSFKADDGFTQSGALFALTRAVLGAAIGGTQVEDPQQKALNALLGAGVGSIASPALARKIVDIVSDPKVADFFKSEDGAIFPKRKSTRHAWTPNPPGPNTARMGTSTHAKQVARGINERLSQMKKLASDVRVTHDETITRSMSSEYRKVENILALGDDVPLNAADRTAVRDFRDLMIEDTLELAGKAASQGDAAAAEKVWENYLLLQQVSRKVKNVETSVARSQEAGNIITAPARAKGANIDYDTVAKAMLNDADALGKGNVTKNEVVQAILELGDRARVAKLASDAAAAPSAWWKIYYGLNLLSTPLFHPKNIIGNSLAMTASILGRATGEAMSMPFFLTGKQKMFNRDLVAPGETWDLIIGLKESIRDARRLAGHKYRTGESLVFHGHDKFAERADLLAQHRESGFLPVIIDSMARLAEKNLRFAGGTDEFFKVLAFTGEQRALARRQAWGSGAKTRKDALKLQADLLADTPEDILRQAESFAEEVTFTQAFDRSKWSGRLMGRAQDLAGEGFMRLTVTPFFQTPMRITEFATEHTPVLNLLMSGWWGDIQQGGARAQLALSKVAVGAGTMYVLSSYAAAGLITGDWSTDPALRARQKESGWKPFSFYVPVVDKYVSYKGLGPMVAPIAAVAQYAQMAPHMSEHGILNTFMAMTIAAAKTTMAQPYFDAMNDVVDIFEKLDTMESAQAAVKYVSERIQTLIPGQGALRALAEAIDPEPKDLKEFGGQFDPEYRDVFNLLAAAASDIPGVSLLVPAKKNVITGDPIPNDWGRLAGLLSTPTQDKVLREIVELGGAGIPQDFPRHVGGDKAPEDTFRVAAPKPGTVQPLDHKQRERLIELATKDIKIDGKNMHEYMTELVGSERYNAQSDGRYGGKSLLLNTTWHRFVDGASLQLLSEDAGLREQMRAAKVEKLLKLQPPASQ